MNKSVIVYGPQDCGKTTNGERLRRHFNLAEIHEGLPERIRKKFREEPSIDIASVGVLYLTDYTREQLIAEGVIDAAARRVFSFEEAMAQIPPTTVTTLETRAAAHHLVDVCHGASFNAGWWNGKEFNPLDEVRRNTRIGKALVAEKLCLIHSEVSEAMEGHRKGLQDDKLPHRSMLEVELADAVIRIADLAGALDLDLGGAIAEKMAFNAVRPDHKKEARESAGGKSY